MPTNVTQVSGATPADIYLGNYAYADILASMDPLRFKLDTAGTNRLFYKNAAGTLFKTMCDASADSNHAEGLVLFTDADGAADSDAALTWDGTLLGVGDAISGVTSDHHMTVGDDGAAAFPQVLIGADNDNFLQAFHDNANGYFCLQQRAGGTTYSNMIVGQLGDIGVGTADPLSRLEVYEENDSYDSVTYLLTVTHEIESGSTPAAGCGAGIRIGAETQYGPTSTGDIAVWIEGIWTSMTTDAETSDLYLYVTHEPGGKTEVAHWDSLQNMMLFSSSVEDWAANYSTLSLSTAAMFSIDRSGGNEFIMGVNAYYDAADSRWERIGSGKAAQVYLNPPADTMSLRMAAHGAADASITWIDCLSMSSSGAVTTGGNLTVGGLINFPASGDGLISGEIYADDNSTATTLALQDTLYQVLIFTDNGYDQGVSPSYTDGHLVINSPGRYKVEVSLSAYSMASNTYYWQVAKNNGTTTYNNLEQEQITDVAGHVSGITLSGIIPLEANDTVELWVQRTDGGAVSKDIVATHVNMIAWKIGGYNT